MTIVSPSGKEYQWNGANPPTADDIAQLQQYEARSIPQNSSTRNIAAPAAVAQTVDQAIPRPDATTGPTHGMDPFAYTGAAMASPSGQQAMQQVGTTIKNMGLEGGGATLGQMAGAPFAELGGVQIGGAIGAGLGNVAAQLTTPGQPFSLGQVGAAMTAGAVPGASLAKATAGQVIKQGAKYAGANVLGANLQSLIDSKGDNFATPTQDAIAAGAGFLGAPISKALDSGEMAEASRVASSQDSVRRETLNAGRGLGLVVPPSVTAPNVANNTLSSIAGKAAVAQEAVLRNQPKINDAVRAEIGLPTDAPLSPISLNTARVAPNLVYDQISKTSPEAAGLLSQFKGSMDDARQLRSAYRASIDAGTPNNAALAAAKAAETQADVFRNGLSQIVHPDLMSYFDQARTQLAKIGLAERALNLGDGNIDAKVFGQALDSGERLTGNFKTIGRFQNAFGRYVQEAAKTPASGVDYLKTGLKIGGGIGAAAAGHPIMGIAAPIAMTAAEAGSRKTILSPAYQQAFASPFYGPTTEDFVSGLARMSAMNAGRQN